MANAQRAIMLVLTLLFSTLTGMIVHADDTESSAVILTDGTYEGFVCFPDCDGIESDMQDWYSVGEKGQSIQVWLENKKEPNHVDLILSSSIGNLTVGSNENKSILFQDLQSSVDFEIYPIDGFGGDGTNYSLTIESESNGNNLFDATNLDYGITNVSSIDGNDWFEFTAGKNESIAITLDSDDDVSMEIYENSSVQHSIQGDSGNQQMWFNTTEPETIQIQVTSDSRASYSLNLLKGDWIDVKEDEYYYLPFSDVSLNDRITATAIRTESPNDLDILLYNESMFLAYRERIIGNDTEVEPEEILAVRDCLTCSIDFIFDANHAGTTGLRDRLLKHNHTLDWTPVLYFVADYTNYLGDPPMDGKKNVASVFLSLQVVEQDNPIQGYEVEYLVDDAWIPYETGETSNSRIENVSWNNSATGENAEYSFTDYRVKSSVGDIEVVNDTFRVINNRPLSCMEFIGGHEGRYYQFLPLDLEMCYHDADGDDVNILINGWDYGGVTRIGYSGLEGLNSIDIKLIDQFGLVSNSSVEVEIQNFSHDLFEKVADKHYGSLDKLSYTVNTKSYDNYSIIPELTDFELLGKRFGVGINAQSLITHEVKAEFNAILVSSSPYEWERVTHVTSSAKKTVSLNLNLSVIIQDLTTGDISSFECPLPTSNQLYENQSGISVPLLFELFYWDEMVLMSDTGWQDFAYGRDRYNFSIQLEGMNLLEYIKAMASKIPGAQLPLLVTDFTLDTEVLLSFDLNFSGSLSGDFGIKNEYNMYANYISNHLKEDENYSYHVEYSENTGTEMLFGYSYLQNTIAISGNMGLKFRIAQPEWMTLSLNYLLEDPMLMEGIWHIDLLESNGDIVSDSVTHYALSNELYYISKPSDEITQNQTATEEETNNSSVVNEKSDIAASDDESMLSPTVLGMIAFLLILISILGIRIVMNNRNK